MNSSLWEKPLKIPNITLVTLCMVFLKQYYDQLIQKKQNLLHTTIFK